MSEKRSNRRNLQWSFLFPLLHLPPPLILLSKPHNEKLEIQHFRQWGGGGGAFSRGHHRSIMGRRKAVHRTHTANEGPVRIQYKCLVPIYVFPEMKLCGLVISKTELLYIVLSPNCYTVYTHTVYL